MLDYSQKIAALLFVIVFTVVFCGAPASAQESTAKAQVDSDSMAADIALARPVGTVATVAGFALFDFLAFFCSWRQHQGGLGNPGCPAGGLYL